MAQPVETNESNLPMPLHLLLETLRNLSKQSRPKRQQCSALFPEWAFYEEKKQEIQDKNLQPYFYTKEIKLMTKHNHL